MCGHFTYAWKFQRLWGNIGYISHIWTKNKGWGWGIRFHKWEWGASLSRVEESRIILQLCPAWQRCTCVWLRRDFLLSDHSIFNLVLHSYPGRKKGIISIPKDQGGGNWGGCSSGRQLLWCQGEERESPYLSSVGWKRTVASDWWETLGSGCLEQGQECDRPWCPMC